MMSSLEINHNYNNTTPEEFHDEEFDDDDDDERQQPMQGEEEEEAAEESRNVAVAYSANRKKNWIQYISTNRSGFLGLFGLAVIIIIISVLASPSSSNSPSIASSASASSQQTGEQTATTSSSNNDNQQEPEHSNSNNLKLYNKTHKGCFETDRFDNDRMKHVIDTTAPNYNRLYVGQYICNKGSKKDPTNRPPNRYQFGVDKHGNIIWKDTDTSSSHHQKEKIFFNASGISKNDIGHFALHTDGTMVLYSKNHHNSTKVPLWKAKPTNAKFPISQSKLCLSNHDCPYLHLHSDGVMVLNWIIEDGSWQATNFLHIYDGFDNL